MADDVPIVVVTTNAAKHLPTWLDSVGKLQGCKPRPFIVDNGSSDRTPGIIWEAVRDDRVQKNDVIWLQLNHWFVPAQNLAFRTLGQRGCRYVATLNEDATADEQWLRELLNAAECASESVGMFCSLILCPNHPDRISSAGHTLRHDGAFLDVDYGRNRDDPMRHSRQTGYEPFAPCFAAALWDLRMIKQVGLPDNDQLIYYDDVDLAYKGRMADWQCCFVPTAIAYHPLPCRPVETTRIRAQFLGRLAIIARYFPDNERELILTREARLADSAWQLEIVATVSRISPVGTQEQRVRLYSDWRDRYPN